MTPLEGAAIERGPAIERNGVDPRVLQYGLLCRIATGPRDLPALALHGYRQTLRDKTGPETEKMRHNCIRKIVTGDKLDASCTGSGP